MKMRHTQLLVSALAYATFRDENVKEKTEELLAVVDKDLNEAGFEPSSDTEDAENELETALNEADDARERLEAAVASAEADEDDDTGGDSE